MRVDLGIGVINFGAAACVDACCSDHGRMTRAVLVVDGKKPCGRPACPNQNPQPVENFTRSSKTPSGFRSWCKTCCRVTNRVFDQARARKPEVAEKKRATASAWYHANREAVLARISAHQAANREVINERFRQYRAEGRYRELDRMHSAKRRAIIAGAEAEKIVFAELFDRDKGICQICLDKVYRTGFDWPHPASASIDHTVPLSKGGSHKWENVRLAHLRCNLLKGDRIETPSD